MWTTCTAGKSRRREYAAGERAHSELCLRVAPVAIGYIVEGDRRSTGHRSSIFTGIYTKVDITRRIFGKLLDLLIEAGFRTNPQSPRIRPGQTSAPGIAISRSVADQVKLSSLTTDG